MMAISSNASNMGPPRALLAEIEQRSTKYWTLLN
jgi:hypothetical protein